MACYSFKQPCATCKKRWRYVDSESDYPVICGRSSGRLICEDQEPNLLGKLRLGILAELYYDLIDDIRG